MGPVLSIVFGAFIGILLTALAGLVLLGRKYRLTPKTLGFSFMNFDVRRFSELTAVKMFSSLSRISILPSNTAKLFLEGKVSDPSPLMLIHLAWHVVCKAYLETYLAYPTEEHVKSNAPELGSQNVEFVILFHKVHEAAIRNEDIVEREFAIEYFTRAPSLAERIIKQPYHPDSLYLLASTMIGVGEAPDSR